MKLQEGESIVHEMGPASQILVIWFFSKCLLPTFVGAFVVFSIFGFFGALIDAGGGVLISRWAMVATLIAAGVGGVIVMVFALTYCVFLRRTYVYYVTNRRCVFRGGILVRVERSVPYHKVTDVERRQSIVERILGISRLNIFTPGTASVATSPFLGQGAEISFVGLKDSETPAATINDLLRQFGATGE